jgi:hypothetical protein
MSEEGLWTIQFSMSEEDHGGLQLSEEIYRGGNFFLKENRLYGGGVSFYLVGTYDVSESSISIIVNATKYNDLVEGPFGPIDEVRILFNGRIEGETMTLKGHFEDEESKQLTIEAVKRVSL